MWFYDDYKIIDTLGLYPVYFGLTVSKIRPSEDSYAGRLAARYRATRPSRRRPAIRELAKELGFSTEHVRQVLNGTRVAVSRDFNDKACRHLGLDPDEMWRLAEEARAKANPSRVLLPPEDRRLSALWRQLSDEEKGAIWLIADAFVAARKGKTG